VTPADVLLACVEAEIVLWLDGDRLRFRAPCGALDDRLRARVPACRGALVALLHAGACLPPAVAEWPEVRRAAFEERAGILEFDGGLAHEAAEREAERLVRVQHARAFVARAALVVHPEAAAVAGERPGGGPHR
jgi:hypothetical protein